MSILVGRRTRLLVQGITGSAGSFHAEQMLDYGTCLVAGVTPGRGGTRFRNSVPVFHTVEQAVRETGANASVIFVPYASICSAWKEPAAPVIPWTSTRVSPSTRMLMPAPAPPRPPASLRPRDPRPA